MSQLRISFWGTFRLCAADGTDQTPRGMKERAMLALLLLSPGQRRRRVWLQDMLWGRSTPEAGQTSLRRALSNIRRDLGPLADLVQSDRGSVWLDPQPIPAFPQDMPAAEFLADLDVPDEEFENWLRDQRQALAPDRVEIARPGAPMALRSDSRPTIAIRADGGQTESGRFVARMLTQEIAQRVANIGNSRVLLDPQPDDAPDYSFTVELMAEDEDWFILVRLLGGPGQACLWSQRLRERKSVSQIWNAPGLVRLLNRAQSALSDQFAIRGPDGDVARLQRAVRRIYNYDRPGLETAVNYLRSSANGEMTGLALGWLSFAQLTSILEFRDHESRNREEALAHAAEAVRLAPYNATVLALASQVQMKLAGDFDYAHHLALQAADEEDSNPYALDALSQSRILRGEYDLGQRTAEQARLLADGLANSFSWDMQAALGALCLENLTEAEALARICHSKMPEYRPALRYLVALNVLADNDADAGHFAARLARIEPGFVAGNLLKDSYPVQTLRRLGLGDDLKSRLG